MGEDECRGLICDRKSEEESLQGVVRPAVTGRWLVNQKDRWSS